MSVLVTGGAGYIGAHVIKLLQDRGDKVVIVDQVTPRMKAAHYAIDLASVAAVAELSELIQAEQVDSVIHFAARKQVGESVDKPLWYYQQNISGLTNLLQAMQNTGVDRFVFSSSAAVYGMPDTDLAFEDGPTEPINPYGETKLIGEWISNAVAKATGLRQVSLRYFNVAGAGWDELGDPYALNLIPIILHRLDRGQQPVVFGNDYDTPDGTCVRDYVHVLDLAEAHLVALDYLDQDDRPHAVFNVGTGIGSSVLEVISALETALGRSLAPIIQSRRAGDPPKLMAAVARINNTLNWQAKHNLADIVESAVSAHRFLSQKS